MTTIIQLEPKELVDVDPIDHYEFRWTVAGGMPFGLLTDWSPDRKCECGNNLFMVTHRPSCLEPLPEGSEKEPKIIPEDRRIVCPKCIDYREKEVIVGEIDYGYMIVNLYDEIVVPPERYARRRVDEGSVLGRMNSFRPSGTFPAEGVAWSDTVGYSPVPGEDDWNRTIRECDQRELEKKSKKKDIGLNCNKIDMLFGISDDEEETKDSEE